MYINKDRGRGFKQRVKRPIKRATSEVKTNAEPKAQANSQEVEKRVEAKQRVKGSSKAPRAQANIQSKGPEGSSKGPRGQEKGQGLKQKVKRSSKESSAKSQTHGSESASKGQNVPKVRIPCFYQKKVPKKKITPRYLSKGCLCFLSSMFCCQLCKPLKIVGSWSCRRTPSTWLKLFHVKCLIDCHLRDNIFATTFPPVKPKTSKLIQSKRQERCMHLPDYQTHKLLPSTGEAMQKKRNQNEDRLESRNRMDNVPC